jgi:hypothetical protein
VNQQVVSHANLLGSQSFMKDKWMEIRSVRNPSGTGRRAAEAELTAQLFGQPFDGCLPGAIVQFATSEHQGSHRRQRTGE